ncbi:hypothetical protein M3Y97_00414200 [Aphelenchoides bicaudatus]|nr:hypothetical protein M3Y97_00414200 [Aphelenchoides bicaudatus]
MLRLLGNLAEFRDTASILTQPNLLDRLAIMISFNSDNSTISNAALRTVRLLSKHKVYVRHIVHANVVSNIGLVLEKRELPAIFKDFHSLIIMEQLKESKIYVRDVGRQLGQSKCTEKLLEIIFAKPTTDIIKRWQQLILNLTRLSCDLREEFGRKAITEIVSRNQINRCISLFLCYFAHDSWARKYLRIDNALPIILKKLAESNLLEEKVQIVAALKFFIYESEGLTIICQRDEITNLCIDSMTYFLENAKRKHITSSFSLQAEEDQMEIAARGDATPRNEYVEKMRTNPMAIKYSKSSPSSSWSQSPLSDYSLSPSPAPTSPLQTIDDIISMTSQPINIETPPTNSEDEAPTSKDKEEQAHNCIISDCIEIFAWRTHKEEGAEFLINEKTLQTFLLFLSDVPSKSKDRLLRLICRVLKSRNYLNKILDVRFPIMTTSILIRQPCLLKRFCNPCEECSERARFARDILVETIRQVDGPFGIAILEKHCSYGDDRFIYALLSGLILLRQTENRNRFIQRWQPFKFLIEKIENILRAESAESIKNNQLLSDIFAMLSLLVPKRCINKLIGRLAEPYRDNFNDECTLEMPADDEPQIEFSTSTGHIISIRADDLFKTNSYFQGMIRHDFLRNSSSHKRLLKFLHYIAGCREKNCVRVSDAKSCVALLHLCDKYSCMELAEELLRSNGPARRFIKGSNVSEFFPVILSSWLYKDRFGYILSLVFFKFSNEAQQKEVFSALSGNGMAIEFFIELISNFLKTIENLTNIKGRQELPTDFI